MTEQQTFLDAICANPLDLGERLIYADWLEENADKTPDPEESRVRAEFIRGQIRWGEYQKEMEESDGCICTSLPMSTLSGSRTLQILGNCRYCTLCDQCAKWKNREKHILDMREGRYAFRWQTGWLAEIEWGPSLGTDFTRLPTTTLNNGFYETISLPFAAFMACGAKIVRRQPIVRMILKDKHPQRAGEKSWCWLREISHEIYEWGLPYDLFVALDPLPVKYMDYSSITYARYASATDALTALHRGAANLARRWAKIGADAVTSPHGVPGR